MADPVFAFFWQMVAAGGGGAMVAWLLAQWLGKRWIESKFNESLEQLKHDQNVVVARLKVEIDSMLSGALKIQEREFDVLPGVWDKLYQATLHVLWFVSTIRNSKEFGLIHLGDAEFEDFVSAQEFSDLHKNELRRAQPDDRWGLYNQLDHQYRATTVRKVVGQFQQYVQSNAIFLPHDLLTKLVAIEKALWSQFEDRERLHLMERMGFEQDPETAFEKVIPPMRDEIEVLIRKRLESHMRAAKEKAST